MLFSFHLFLDPGLNYLQAQSYLDECPLPSGLDLKPIYLLLHTFINQNQPLSDEDFSLLSNHWILLSSLYNSDKELLYPDQLARVFWYPAELIESIGAPSLNKKTLSILILTEYITEV